MPPKKPDTPEELSKLNELIAEAREGPIPFIKHSARARMDSEPLQDLLADYGYEFYGMYWALEEELHQRKGHYFDVSTDRGIGRLAHNLSEAGEAEVSLDKCKRFIEALYKVEAIDRRHYDELHRLYIPRIVIDADAYCRQKAGAKFGAWKTNHARWPSS